MKHEWRKKEKGIYISKDKPEMVTIPPLKYYTINGKGNPNDDFFAEYVAVLYSLAYAVKMSPKVNLAPQGYFEYAVYPLEGVWDIANDSKQELTDNLDLNSLVFKIMIRQPDFVSDDYAAETIERTKKKKPHELLDNVQFETIEEGKCVQMLHLGSYVTESDSFHLMEEYCRENNLTRSSKQHREIYLSDARKVSQEKLKTVLRFKVK